MIGNRIRRVVLPARPGARRHDPAQVLREVSDLESAKLGLPMGSIVLVRHLVKGRAWPDLRTRAFRPALEPFVPEQVEAVWFLDEPELVACLLRDAVCLNLSHWWWRLAFPGGTAPTSVVRVLLGDPGVARVAIGRVVRAGLDAELWSWLGDGFAQAVQERIPVEAPGKPRSAVSEPEQLGSTVMTDSVGWVPPPGRWVGESSSRSPADGVGSEAGFEEDGHPSGADGAPVAGIDAASMPAGAGVSPPGGSDSRSRAPGEAPMEHALGREADREPPTSSPTGQDGSGSDEQGVAAVDDPPLSATRGATSIAQVPLEPRSRAVSAFQEDPEPARSTPAPLREPLPAVIWASAESQVVTTRFGGIFFVLNAAIALGWLPDFTRPSDPGRIGNPWGCLRTLGSRRFGRRFEQDPLHGFLRRLHAESGDPCPEDPELDGLLDRFLEDALELRSRRAWIHLAHRTAAVRDNGARLDVGFRLDGHSLRIRRAGLDRDPGWISSGGRDVRFRFDARGAS